MAPCLIVTPWGPFLRVKLAPKLGMCDSKLQSLVCLCSLYRDICKCEQFLKVIPNIIHSSLKLYLRKLRIFSYNFMLYQNMLSSCNINVL